MHANREDDEPMVDIEGLITEEEKLVEARIAAGEDVDMGPVGKGKEKMQAYEEAQGDEMGQQMQQEQEMHEDVAEGESNASHLYIVAYRGLQSPPHPPSTTTKVTIPTGRTLLPVEASLSARSVSQRRLRPRRPRPIHASPRGQSPRSVARLRRANSNVVFVASRNP